MVNTQSTAAPRPLAVETFLETARYEHIPKNVANTILSIKIDLNNKKNLLKTVNEFEKSLNLIKQYIKQNKSKKIQEVFIKTKKIRKLIEKEKQE